MLFRNHTHAIDLINFLADSEPVWVWAELERGFEFYGTEYKGDGGNDPATEPGANYYIAYANGVRAYLTGVKDTVGPRDVGQPHRPAGACGRGPRGDPDAFGVPRGHPDQARRHDHPATTAALDGRRDAGCDLDLVTAMDEGRDPASPPEAARTTVAITQAILESQARGNIKVHLSEFAPVARQDRPDHVNQTQEQ